MFRNLVTDLLKHEQIKTTEAKAKAIRGLAEKMITLGKNGTLPARRQALAYVYDKDVVAQALRRPGAALRRAGPVATRASSSSGPGWATARRMVIAGADRLARHVVAGTR